MRAVWPADRPMSVRISATDWMESGTTADDAVLIARAFADAGADVIDVSTGQVHAGEKPAFGRSYQTPFADRIRNETGIATMAVGAISSYDDVNSILLAGRADSVPARPRPPVRPTAGPCTRPPSKVMSGPVPSGRPRGEPARAVPWRVAWRARSPDSI